MSNIEEDERREAALGSTPCLQPNSKPVGVTNLQLSKFQYKSEVTISIDKELHKRRLQIKATSKSQKKPKGRHSKSSGKDSKYVKLQDCTEENDNKTSEESSVLISKGKIVEDKPSLQQGYIAPNLVAKKHQKLHWGLDTKERWERKANM